MIEDLQNIELDALHMPIKLMCQNMAQNMSLYYNFY